MEYNFDPEKEIPDLFWDFVSKTEGKENIARRVIKEMNKSDVINHYRIYRELKAEMDYLLSSRNDNRLSEDSVSDLSEAIITMGKQDFLNIFSGRENIPNSWEDLPNIWYLFDEIFYENFNEELSLVN